MFKAKLRKIGNSIGIIIPKNEVECYNIGDVIELNVITNGNKEDNVITPRNTSTIGRKLVFDKVKGIYK
jgi:antitoxin component of MazEF toxin-antitoxin module